MTTLIQQPPSIDALLSDIGLFLANSPRVILEWSLTGRKDSLRDRHRITCWVTANTAADSTEDKQETFAGINQLLQAIAPPPHILLEQQKQTPSSIRQGISVALSDQSVEWRLYLHTRPPNSGRDQYQSYRWIHADAYQTDTYRFYYAPKTPEGHTPLDLAHPLFKPAVQDLVNHERWAQTSGFWLRFRDQQVKQIDFAYPWYPQLRNFASPLQTLSSALGLSFGWFDTYADYPIRHIALTEMHREPAFTIYFSAPMGDRWPATLKNLKETVFKRGQSIHDSLEQHFFTQIPLQTPQEKGNEHGNEHRDIGDFYDTQDLEAWQHVLGKKMHYHFGLFDRSIDPSSASILADQARIDAAFDRAVSVLYPFIPVGSRVYDLGCGWGGPARQLARDLNCKVEGITASWSQFLYCTENNLLVRHGNMETSLPTGYFNCMLLLESLCHVRDKLRLLKILRLFGKKLILRDHCQDRSPASMNFGGTMHMISSTELKALVEQAGWHIVHWRNCRAESMPSIHHWKQRLQDIPTSDDIHLETLRAFCNRVSGCADEWAEANPLIELVAT